MINRTSRSSTHSPETTAPPSGGMPRVANTQAGMTIRRLRLIAFLGLLLLVAASVAVTFATLRTQRDDALVINIAGRQRMLIQQMTLMVLGVQVGANPAYFEDLHDTAHDYFEQTLDALIAGGQVPYFDETTITLAPTRDLIILAQLETVRAMWEEMHDPIHVVLESDPQDPAFARAVGEVERLSPMILSQMDEAVRLYEAEASRKVALAQAIQIGFLGAAVALLIVASVLSERWLLQPIDQFNGAAQRIGEGDLNTPLSIAGPGEIRQLERSFNDMRQNLAASRAESERHTQEQAALLELSRSLIAQLDTNTILDQAAGRVQKIFCADLVSLMFPDASGDNLILRAGRGWEGDLYGLYRADVATSREGYTFRSGEPVWLEDVQASTRFACPQGLRERGIQSSLTAPMNADYGTLGTLCVHYREQRKFDGHDVRLLSLIANTTAQAFDRTRLYSSAQERLERISALHDIDIAITSSLELYERLDTLLEKVTERLRVDAAAVALINPDTHELNYAALRGLDGEFFTDGLLKVKEGIAGQVAYSGEVAVIPDVSAEPRFVRRAIAARLGIVSYLAVPLRARGAVIGVLELAARERHEFLSEEIDFFVTLAGQAAIAIENARLFDETRRRAVQQGSLAETAGAILATLDIDALWPAVAAGVRETLAADRAAVYLYDPATDRLTCPYASNLSTEYVAEINRRFREVPGGRLLSDPQPILIADAQTDPAAASLHDLAAREGFHSYAIFPLAAPDISLGAFVAYRDLVAPFSQNDIATGQMLAHIVAVAMQNARLFEAERIAREQAETLRVATQALSTSLDLQQVFDLILSELQRVVPYDSASVQQLKGERLEIIGGHGFPNLEELLGMNFDVTAGDNPNGEVIRTRAPLILEDASAIYQEFRRGPHAAAGIRSWLGVPLLFGDQLIGIIALDKQEPGFYTANHARLALAFAAQAAVAIENASLFESLTNEQHNTGLLYQLSMELAVSLNPQDVANRALRAVTNAIGVSRGNILTVENNGDNMQLLAVTGYDRETVSAINQRLNWNTSQGVTGRVIQTRTAAIVSDVSQDPFWVPISGLDDWVKSIVSVPLITGDVVVGVLNLLSEELDFFKPERLPLITAIASPVALALQNARLYESLRQRFKELEILADTSSALRKAGSFNDIPPILLAKAVEGLKADAGVLLLLENDELKFTALHGETSVSTGDTCPPDSGMMWQVLESGKPLFIPDVTQIEELHKSTVCQALMGGALSCACVPLRTTTSAIGVVYLNWKKKSFLSANESRLLESLAEIAANAIHRSSLHLQTVQQAQDLTLAYDATIEGWSRALDLRDKETEDHTLRVTEMTLQLALAVGLNESELLHIRRGALLHDIGKMGVPDGILLKPGPLTDDEWKFMRRHPQLAYEMLSPIAYLQPALDIPYCHHEKWDGTGYPRGLKGEEIPLTARIFAVVDVYDALTSDRPYRPAWTKRKTAAYIRQQAGIHFDPKVVDIFYKMVRKK